MKSILKDLQSVIHAVNPYVNEFKQVMEEDYTEEMHAGIVFSDKGRETGPHSGAYNPVTNCNELFILTDTSKPAYSDLVVRRQDDGKK